MLFLITNEDIIHLCCEQYIKLAKKVLAVHSEMSEPIEKVLWLDNIFFITDKNLSAYT